MQQSKNDEKIYKAADVSACGFAVKNLFAQIYPNGLTAAEMHEEAKKHMWVKFVYERVVLSNGV